MSYGGRILPKEIVILLGHGSKEKHAKQVLVSLKNKLSKCILNKALVFYAFIQFNSPTLTKLFKRLRAKLDLRRIKRVIIIPAFLSYGKHTNSDLPKLVNEIKEKQLKAYNKKIDIKIALPLGSDNYIVKLLLKRYKEVVSRH